MGVPVGDTAWVRVPVTVPTELFQSDTKRAEEKGEFGDSSPGSRRV